MGGMSHWREYPLVCTVHLVFASLRFGANVVFVCICPFFLDAGLLASLCVLVTTGSLFGLQMQDLFWNSHSVISYNLKTWVTGLLVVAVVSLTFKRRYCSNDAPTVLACQNSEPVLYFLLLTALEERQRARQLWHVLKLGEFAQEELAKATMTKLEIEPPNTLVYEKKSPTKQSISLADPQQTHTWNIMKQFSRSYTYVKRWLDRL